jgi:hypothetical protein
MGPHKALNEPATPADPVPTPETALNGPKRPPGEE